MKIFALLIFLFFLSACSRLDLALSYAPRYITNEVDDAFDLNSERYGKIKSVVTKDIDKNKNAVFNEIIVKIEYLLLLTDKKDLSATEIRYLYDSSKKLQQKIIYMFKLSFTEVLADASGAELQHLHDYANDKFKNSDEKFNNRKKFNKHYIKNYERYMDMLFGSSNKAQDLLYRQFLNENYEYLKYQNEARKLFLKKFETLHEKKSEMLELSMQYYSGNRDSISEDYMTKQEAFNVSIVNLINNIWNESSARQKLNFKNTLMELKENIRSLMGGEY